MNFKFFLLYVKVKWTAFYYFIIFFVIMTLICGFIVGQSITPFYVYQMYSQVLNRQKLYDSFDIEVNGEDYNPYKLTKERRDIIYYNFSRYIYLKEHNGHDKYFFKLKEIDKYNWVPNFAYNRLLTLDLNNSKEWLKSLIAFDFKEKITIINIYKIQYFYDSNHNVRVYSRVKIDSFQYD